MEKPQSPEQSELAAAAEALEAELRRFEALVDAAQREPLASQQDIERAAELLMELSRSNERFGVKLRTLAAGIAAVKDRQQAKAGLLLAHAKQVERRGEDFQALLQRHLQLRELAGKLDGFTEQLATQARELTAPEARAALEGIAHQLEEQVARALQGIQELLEAASALGFVDVEREAGRLSLRLQASRQRVGALQQELSLRP